MIILPFGLSSAPYIFTKCLRPMVRYWRQSGVNIVLYLDDGLGLAESYEKGVSDSLFVKDSLEKAGFLVNLEKSIFEPCQMLEWLGMIWNTNMFCLSIPERRIQDCKSTLADLFHRLPKITARQLAQFTGKVISMGPVIGNISRLMTRKCYEIIESRFAWDSLIRFDSSHEFLQELSFWSKNLDMYNCRFMKDYSKSIAILCTDASSVAAGAVCQLSDVFQTGRWASIQTSGENLADLKFFCEKSKSESTFRKYRYAFNSWIKWCYSQSPKVQHFPASDFNVSIYLINLSKQFNSVAKVNEAFYAISWAHEISGTQNPCHSSLVVSVLEGARRLSAKPVTKKEPITSEILQQIVNRYGTGSSSLPDIRISCMCLLSYAAFLRFSELVNLKRSDITFYEDHLSLYISKSKTDKYKTGSNVIVSKTNNVTCSYGMLQLYLKIADIASDSDCFIFRALSFCKKSGKYKLRNSGPLSYSRARELLLNALESVGVDKSKFGLHSLRSGGATAAANAGVSDRLFKKHGRWRSDNAKDGYVHENVKSLMSVSQSLNI
ncbi:integrase/recombinase xerD homolog isoform X4 [Magallana gigas]|uniref:integrase/recombinase xerD homolog isoform X4 n=1 Tax=Magallana gigas TaxID=29159 RepID=UPI003342B27A